MKNIISVIIFFFFIQMGNCQPFGRDFTSRIESQHFTPEFILGNKISSVEIIDHMTERIPFKYEFFFDRSGNIKSYSCYLEGYSKDSRKIRIDPMTSLFYHTNNADSILDRNKTARIYYSFNNRIEKVVYDYHAIIIGCPLRRIYLDYDSNERIIKDCTIDCQDSIISNHNYQNNLIAQTTTQKFRLMVIENDSIIEHPESINVSELSGRVSKPMEQDRSIQDEQNYIYSKLETENYEYLFTDRLLIEIRSLDNPERFKRYSYRFIE